MKEIRIQRKRIKGWKMPENTVYVGRPTKWGNPYSLTSKNNEDYIRVVEFYKKYFKINFPQMRKELKGKNLACWCPLDQLCHADVLLEVANL